MQWEKENLKERVEEELPSWAAWALKPLAGFFHDIQAMQNNSRGEDGETSAFFNLWLFLPKEWVLLNPGGAGGGGSGHPSLQTRFLGISIQKNVLTSCRKESIIKIKPNGW